MSMKLEFDDDDLEDPVGATIDLLDEKPFPEELSVSISPTDEFMLSDSSDNIVTYRIVQMPNEDSKDQLYQATTSSISPTIPQQVQYFLIDNTNGIVQAVPTTTPQQISPTSSIAPKVDVMLSAASLPSTSSALSPLSSLSSLQSMRIISKPPKVRPSIAIAPATAPKATATKANVRKPSDILSTLRPKRDEKREDRRRATHNEVERRRRDNINHWIMKLGSIIPADGKSHEIGSSGRVSIAAIEGQSKGGILSKAFEYVQKLQTNADGTANGCNETTHTTALDKKRFDDEIARLRGENELLKAILIKHGINYVKERHMFRPNDYS